MGSKIPSPREVLLNLLERSISQYVAIDRFEGSMKKADAGEWVVMTRLGFAKSGMYQGGWSVQASLPEASLMTHVDAELVAGLPMLAFEYARMGEAVHYKAAAEIERGRLRVVVESIEKTLGAPADELLKDIVCRE